MDASSSNSALSQRSVLFARGVLARLEIWPILRVAVDSSWGGPNGAQKRTWLAGVIVDAFEDGSVSDDQYVEEMLLQVLQDEFDTDVEDGSGEPVAQDIMKMWEESGRGVDTTVKRFEESAEKIKRGGQKVQVQVEDTAEVEGDDDEDWEDDEEEDGDNEPAPQLIERKPKPEPQVDEDGFTMVTKRR